jgi:26S proteasome regulatory subunit T2
MQNILIYGPSGCGKTLLVKAIANSILSKTNSKFYHLTGNDLVNKGPGEGAKIVRNLFKEANENSPAIIYIDKIEAIGEKRHDNVSGGEKEIQRIMIELLTQIDGFESNREISVIMETSCIECLDPALIRPGRIDRKIYVPYPNELDKKKIFKLFCEKISLENNINPDTFLHGELSGNDIKKICTEAGLIALNERRVSICQNDFIEARIKMDNNCINNSQFSNCYL